MFLFNYLKNELKYILLKLNWKKLNKHNFTTIGKGTYGKLNIKTFGSKKESLKIGNYVSIAAIVTFILGGNHYYKTLSTHPFKKNFNIDESLSKELIIVEDYIWIGNDVLVLSVVKLGKCSVIAARSVVTKDIEPYSIVTGNPCKIIKYRFEEDIIKALNEIDFNLIDKFFFINNKKLMYSKIDIEVIEKNKKRAYKKMMVLYL
ncbi:CatB-related O-acetyltransferase [Carnobacterium maltaromaticum]|uniref:CatB-related O-acetyltransferase n=1 Tax=Carnobacterium maltaromaticum TaxID=2751 RepID=UPI00298B0426|nr:CatB-related O-acetyltransferase [Carnobacterium maltaromaticum]MDW5525423.1 CatB-related O-acetyltransferase [Carnobacterium maltaromaticum]